MAPAKPAASPENASAPPAHGLFALWLGVAALVLLLDQWSKHLILQHFELGEGTVITSFFNIVRAHNTGAAFSFLAGAGGWQRWFFVLLALAVSAFILRMLWLHARDKLLALSLSLILGGALGNVLDRLLHGYVVDFLDFHWALLQSLFYGGHYPAFNIADSAITAGVVGLILNELLLLRARRQAN